MIRTLRTGAALLAFAIGGLGCATSIDKLEAQGALEVALDCKLRVYGPHVTVPLKFWVDIVNKSGGTVLLEHLRIELRASPADTPDWTVLKQAWTYRNAQAVALANGKRFTIPIVPEQSHEVQTGSEFPLDLLPEGPYSIVAVVNGRHESKPCSIRIERPDVKLMGRR